MKSLFLFVSFFIYSSLQAQVTELGGLTRVKDSDEDNITLKSYDDETTTQLQTISLNNRIVLSWQVSNQFSDFCEIQKSEDGINFYTIDIVDHPSSVVNYTDYTSEEGQYFYRVKFIGLDKQSISSPIASVNHKAGRRVYLQRTVIMDELGLQFDQEYSGKLTVTIKDSDTDQFVQTEDLGFIEVTSLSSLAVFVEDLDAGRYKAQIKGNNIDESIEFEKL